MTGNFCNLSRWRFGPWLALVLLAVPVFISGQAGPSYPDGALLRAENDFRVWVVHNGKKRWIKNISVFDSYGFDWRSVRVLPPKTLEALPLGTLVRLKGDPQGLPYKRTRCSSPYTRPHGI